MLTFILLHAHTHIKTRSWKNIETDDSLKCFGINSSSSISYTITTYDCSL